MAIELTKQEELIKAYMFYHAQGKLYATLSLFAPIVFAVLVSLISHNWWFMFGILASYIGGNLGLRSKYFAYASIAICIIYWALVGFKYPQYVPMFLLFFVLGSICFRANRKYILIKTAIQKEIENIEEQAYNEVERKLNEQFPDLKL